MEPTKEMSEGEQIPSLKINLKRRRVPTFRSRGAPLDYVCYGIVMFQNLINLDFFLPKHIIWNNFKKVRNVDLRRKVLKLNRLIY